MVLQWTSAFFRSQDGLNLHYRMIGPDSARLPVICLPGLSRNVDDFMEIGAHLAEQGRRVIALDSRGRGLSDFDPNWQNYALPVELGDVLALLDHLNVSEAIFLGTSRGGLLSALLAMVRPQAVKGAILNDIGPIIELSGLKRIRGYIGKLPQPTSLAHGAEILKSVFGPQFPLLDAPAWDRYARRSWHDINGSLRPRYDVNLLRTLIDLDLETPTPPLWPQFAALSVAPMLVIRGDLSDLLSQSTAEEMVRRHPDALLVMVPQQGHAPLLDDAPTMRAIADFVARLA